jgi:hypothetical protein
VIGQNRGIHDGCKSSSLESISDTVASWELDLSEAGSLFGVEEATVRQFLPSEALDVSEEVVARIVMVAQIRTALDLCWSPSFVKTVDEAPQWRRPRITEHLRLKT